jgi:hypothetical protein
MIIIHSAIFVVIGIAIIGMFTTISIVRIVATPGLTTAPMVTVMPPTIIITVLGGTSISIATFRLLAICTLIQISATIFIFCALISIVAII